ARYGDFDEAERLARGAVAAGAGTGMLDPEAQAYADLGAVLALAARHDEAAGAYEQARSIAARKGNVVAERRFARQLAALGPRAADAQAKKLLRPESLCDRAQAVVPCQPSAQTSLQACRLEVDVVVHHEQRLGRRLEKPRCGAE